VKEISFEQYQWAQVCLKSACMREKMGANIKQSIVALLIILAVSICFLGFQQVIAQTDQATIKLQAANTVVNQAFIAVLDAEEAGAKVTDLLIQLSYAQDILARAENSYRVGDLTRAGIHADNVLPIAQKIISNAQSAKLTATVNEQNAFYSTVAFTVFGCFVFVLLLFMFWRRFKRRYIKDLSEAKPELVRD